MVHYERFLIFVGVVGMAVSVSAFTDEERATGEAEVLYRTIVNTCQFVNGEYENAKRYISWGEMDNAEQAHARSKGLWDGTNQNRPSMERNLAALKEMEQNAQWKGFSGAYVSKVKVWAKLAQDYFNRGVALLKTINALFAPKTTTTAATTTIWDVKPFAPPPPPAPVPNNNIDQPYRGMIITLADNNLNGLNLEQLIAYAKKVDQNQGPYIIQASVTATIN